MYRDCFIVKASDVSIGTHVAGWGEPEIILPHLSAIILRDNQRFAEQVLFSTGKWESISSIPTFMSYDGNIYGYGLVFDPPRPLITSVSFASSDANAMGEMPAFACHAFQVKSPSYIYAIGDGIIGVYSFEDSDKRNVRSYKLSGVVDVFSNTLESDVSKLLESIVSNDAYPFFKPDLSVLDVEEGIDHYGYTLEDMASCGLAASATMASITLDPADFADDETGFVSQLEAVRLGVPVQDVFV